MRDGQECTISLTRSFSEGGAIFYELQICWQGETYLTSMRYSALRSIAIFLPNCDVKFPEPSHFISLISQVTGNVDFFKKRQQQLAQYFQSISKITELENSLGLTMLIQKATKSERNSESLPCPPSAPRIYGKKLVAKVIEEEIYNG